MNKVFFPILTLMSFSLAGFTSSGKITGPEHVVLKRKSLPVFNM
jgi:hypothetical protein